MAEKTLDVYLLGNKVGQFKQEITGRFSFQYLESWLKKEEARPLSISLPLQSESFDDRYTRPYFAGLLPDDNLRIRLAAALGVSDKNDYSMLEVVGGECAGAVALYPKSTTSKARLSGGINSLSSKQLLNILHILKNKPLLAGERGVRLSLAGAQNKLAVCLDEDKNISLAKGSKPTTHIIKPSIDRIPASVENEFFCMRLAHELGLAVPHVEYRVVNDISFFLIQRYDRSISKDGTITRLHQEDFCQALSIPPENKYEREGGPNLERCFKLLEKCNQPAKDKLNLIKIIIFNFLIGNADAHGKNFSLIHEGKNSAYLAPFYDLYCTRIYPELDKKMAMKIGGKYKFEEIHKPQWEKLANSADVKPSLIFDNLKLIAQKLLVLSVQVQQEMKEYKDMDQEILEDIVSYIKKSCNKVLDYL